MASKVLPLKRTSEFSLIAKKGKKVKIAPWLVLQVLDSGNENSYFGSTVSRKVATAVIRNKLKRWVRDFAQSKWPKKFETKKVVFVFRPQTSDTFFYTLKHKEFLETLGRYSLK